MIGDVRSQYQIRLRYRVEENKQSDCKKKIDHSKDSLESDGKIKSKVLSVWNNMKYGWTVKLKTNFSKHSPVWLLGRCYRISSETPDVDGKCKGFEDFKADFISKLWFTYRREFPLLSGSHYTTDCGWGCMLRSGQMLLAQALTYHLLGRDWLWGGLENKLQIEAESSNQGVHSKIIKWFADNPSEKSPLSIHTLVKLGEASGKKAGDWYGPGAVAHILRQAVHLAGQEIKEFSELFVYVAQDCTVYTKDILDEMHFVNDKGSNNRAVIILIPVRLGMEKMNIIYGPHLTKLLSMENCLGIIGGRPKHSLYFVGYQDDCLIYLDPHYCQDVVDIRDSMCNFSSFHCKSPRKMNISKLDPSCCIGFYCKDEAALYVFINEIKRHFALSSNPVEYPLFIFNDGSSSASLSLQNVNVPDLQYLNEDHNSDRSDTDDDDLCNGFLFL